VISSYFFIKLIKKQQDKGFFFQKKQKSPTNPKFVRLFL
jgi:hypothetical protein